jgi:hypothetical protein
MSEDPPSIQDFKDFLENYNDPNFRKLFEEFTKTLTNPNERAQFQEEMKKMHQLQLNNGAPSETNLSFSVPQESLPQASSNLQLVDLNQPPKPKEPQDPLKASHGFCIRTSASVYRDYKTISLPLYINVCHSELIKPALARKNCSHGHAHGHCATTRCFVCALIFMS